MPKLCEGCGFYTADNAPTACPSCDAALKFTFLPPAGKDAAPLTGAPRDPYGDLERRQQAARAGLFGLDWRIGKAVAVGLVVVTGMGVRFYLRQEARAEREVQQTATDRGRDDSKDTWRNGLVTAVEPDDAGDDEPRPTRVVHPAERLVAPPGAAR